ncbi:MAG TPA: crotonyl-CoA carboxylase/reductase, partial [Hyphomonas sp.]|nr:crotonyl-CoA carboxylase/reductase [Hyphomonas sp.]
MSNTHAAALSETGTTLPAGEIKDLYEVGEIPPLGHVPSKMYAWAIRKERHGVPEKAMQVEIVDTPELDSHDVLILVMAA